MEPVILLEPELRLLRANNPSPLTGAGTNTYIVGARDLCVIDPGPSDPQHLEAILRVITDTGRLRAILVTHSHLDHSPLARPLSDATGAPVLAFGNAGVGRTARMEALARPGLVGGGEGVDGAFVPDTCLSDGEIVTVGDERLRALWTPGHFGNHLCFVWRDAVFSGDHVMGWSSTLVSPPDGDLAAYMHALDRLEAESARRLYPGHGAPVDMPKDRISELRLHRMQRESQILAALEAGPRKIEALVAEIYVDVPESLHRAAGRNVLAHLIDLEGRGIITATPMLGADAVFSLRRDDPIPFS
ncbi:MAG: MBL fold metallo-hydrolase [Roseinatronobacter sp.]